MRRLPDRLLFIGLLLLCFTAFGQQTPPTQLSLRKVSSTTPRRYGPAETLYEQLRTADLDDARVYHVRNLNLDRGEIHISLDDGVIAFTHEVEGKITGAFFEGDGDVLLAPPNQVERASMTLFTGAAILEERFVTAYFRWNDDTFAEMQAQLASEEHGAEFVTQWDDMARNLAEVDALRLLVSFSRLLPEKAQGTSPSHPINGSAADDRLFHGRIQGRKLGVFDIYYDSTAAEQIWAGQAMLKDGSMYYDVWTSFSLSTPAKTRSLTPGPERDPIRISDYLIDTDLKPPTELSAEAWLQIDVRKGGERTVLFELSRFLQLDDVECDGQRVEYIHNQAIEGTALARRGNDLVAVIFPRTLEAGQHLNLHFSYKGDVLSQVGAGLLYVGERGTWYPNRGIAMSRFDLRFRYPAEWTLVATGTRVTESAPAVAPPFEAPPGQESSRWISESPIPLAGFNLGKYQRSSVQANKISVDVYATRGVERNFPQSRTQEALVTPPPGLGPKLAPIVPVAPAPPSPARNEQQVASNAAHALQAYEAWFGSYPYQSLAITQLPGNLSQGWPGLIFLSSFSFLNGEERYNLHLKPADELIMGQVAAHEIAHQWWGDLVTWRGYRDQWVAEGLANYSSLMLLESKNPQKFQEVMRKYRDDLLQKNKEGYALSEAGPVTLGARLSSAEFPDGYEAISYGRGTWLFHMLRCAMRDSEARRSSAAASTLSDEPFVRALRQLRDRYSGQAIDTADLMHVFEEELPRNAWYEGKQSLDWFYRGWVNGTAIPKFILQGVRYADHAGATTVTGTIVQQNAPDDLVSYVPIYSSGAGRVELMGRVFVDGSRTRFRLSARAGTRKIEIDPQRTLLTAE